MKHRKLADFIYNLLGQGELVFSKKTARCALSITDSALRNSIKRQVDSNKLHRLMKGYYLIIPPEYQNLGFVPPELFIDDLMKNLGLFYYVGLLSAASFQGATHQSSQVFQVMVKTPLRPIILKSAKVKFYVNKNADQMLLNILETERGSLMVSVPAITCFDLVNYRIASGGINQVATTLKELAERIDGVDLYKVAPRFSLASSQRLGYLLEILGYSDLSGDLLTYIDSKKSYQYVPLVDKAGKGQKNQKWHIIINEAVDSDL